VSSTCPNFSGVEELSSHSRRLNRILASVRYRTKGELQALIDDEIPESAGLEYKVELRLDTRNQRAETLKDLTGMANGGGGTIIYGLAEGPGDWPVPTNLTPLSDRKLIGRLENIVRAGVQPPLIVELEPVDVAGGFALVIDVQPSPLGPYMVDGYDERRYYARSGRHVDRMSEQQIRDAYALAIRARERRPEVWDRHGLPRTPLNEVEVWLVISALPEEPLTEILDMLTITSEALQPPAAMATYINNWHAGDFTPALEGLARWVDGFHSIDMHDGPYRELRLHRDGAAAITTRLPVNQGILDPVRVARVANTTLLYLGWFWEHFALAQPVETHVALHNATGKVLYLGTRSGVPDTSRQIAAPPGLSVNPITLTEVLMPPSVSRASGRHHLLMRFMDRLCQAAGEMRCEPMFRRGQLYDRAGEYLHAVAGGRSIFDFLTNGQSAWIDTQGVVTNTHTGAHVGWFDQGVLTDTAGDAVAVLEFAPGPGCPPRFVGTTLLEDAFEGLQWVLGEPTPPQQHAVPAERPGVTGEWSETDLRTLLAPG
jgi:hypothetical protein